MRGGILTIDLKKISDNYQYLKKKASTAEVSAVVKADAYGLGMIPVVHVLVAQGCRTFFVADIEEGIKLRNIIQPYQIKHNSHIKIYVIHGLHDSKPEDFYAYQLTPIINQPHEILNWFSYQESIDKKLPYALHVDTGMSKLGFTIHDFQKIEDHIKYHPCLLMSHLSCSDEPENIQNQRQKSSFLEIAKKFPNAQKSLANSGGIFLDGDYHFDLVRPGKALYGLEPFQSGNNPLSQVVTLQTKIVQHKVLEPQTPVGYGATFITNKKTHVAVISMGYADGLMRILGRKTDHESTWCPYWEDVPLRILGRVSMDLVAIDISALSYEQIKNKPIIDLIGQYNTVDQLAYEMQTMGYEVLTNIGPRAKKKYIHCELTQDNLAETYERSIWQQQA